MPESYKTVHACASLVGYAVNYNNVTPTLTLTLTFDSDARIIFFPDRICLTICTLDLDMSFLKMRCICMLKYQVSISAVSTVMSLWPWRMTLTFDMSPFKMWSLMRYNVHAKHQESISIRLRIFDLWPWMITSTSTCDPLRCAASWDAHACQISSFSLYSNSYGKLSIFDLWPWRMTLTFRCHSQRVWLHKVHMHAKYQMSISTGSKAMANVGSQWFDLYI